MTNPLISRLAARFPAPLHQIATQKKGTEAVIRIQAAGQWRVLRVVPLTESAVAAVEVE